MGGGKGRGEDWAEKGEEERERGDQERGGRNIEEKG